jgi:hypothetical protein
MTQDESDNVVAGFRKKAKADDDMEWMEAILRLGNSATHVEWRTQMHAIKGWSRPTFKRRLRDFKKRHPELTGGRWQSDPYSLSTQPAEAMAERVALLRTWLTPSRAHLISLQGVKLTEPEAREAQVGSAGLRDLPSGEDLIAKAKAHVKSAKME